MPHDGFTPSVRIENLRKFYGFNRVIFDLNAILKPGRFYALLGKNGSGKSTLMRIIAHREQADGGEVTALGKTLEEDFGLSNSALCYVSEAAHFPMGESLSSLITLQSRLHPIWCSDVADRLVKGFHLDLTQEAGDLSRGQLVQLGLVLGLSHNPRLILLDEVTSVLDASARGIIMRELSERAAAGATVLLSTNIVTEVQGVASDYLLLAENKIKISVSADKLSSAFIKIKRDPGVDHPIFQHPQCMEVAFDTDGSITYLMEKSDAMKFSGWEQMQTNVEASASDVFVYLTRLRD